MSLTVTARTDFVAMLSDAGQPNHPPRCAPAGSLPAFPLVTPALNARFQGGASDPVLGEALFAAPAVVDALRRYTRGSAGYERQADGSAVVVACVDAPVVDRGELDVMRDLVVSIAGALLARGLIVRP